MPGRQSSPELIGRVDELQRLTQALERAGTRSGGAVLVPGESGVGKTRLLTEFATQLRDKAVVLAGACLDLADGAPPYWPVIDALRGLRTKANGSQAPSEAAIPTAAHPPGPTASLGALLPALDPASDPSPDPASEHPVLVGRGAQDQLFGDVLTILQREAQRQPVVLIIEDLHWSDRSTRDLLTFLVRNLRTSQVLFVGTYRSDALVPAHPLHGWLAELLRSTEVELMEVPRLTIDEVRLQITSILGGPARPDVVDAVWKRSEGNAFFAEELLAAMVAGRSELPPTLRQVLLARLSLLSEEAGQLVAMVAIAGSPVRHELLAALGVLPEPTLLRALRECVDHQVLLVDARGDGYAFRHNLLRDAVLGQLLRAERAGMHRACARALTEQPGLAHGSAATELAWHWAEAGDHERAVPAAVEAAVVAEAAYGFAEASIHLERALDLWGSAPGATRTLDRLDIALRAAELANLSGDHERAARLARAATESLAGGGTPVPAARAATAWERLGQFLWDAGHSEDALGAHKHAAALAAADPESPEAARVLGAQAAALMQAGRYEESRAAAVEALGLARRAGSRREEVRVLAVLGFDLAYLGDPGGISLLHDARRIAEEDGDLDGIARSYVHLATLLSEPLNLLDEALSVAEEGLERVRALGLERFHGVALQAMVVNTLFRLGRWPEADRRLQSAFDRNPGGTAAIDLFLARAKISLGRGDFASTAADLESVKARASRAIDPRFQAPVLTLEAGQALWEGRLDKARDAVAEGWAKLTASQEVWFAGPLAWHGLRAEADRAQTARTRGAVADIEAARSTAQALLERLRSLTGNLDPAASAVHRAAALYRSMCDGEWSRIEGDSSPEIWESAAAAWDEMRHPYPAAYCRWRLAEALLARQSRSAQATRALRAAAEAALLMGAEPLRRELKALAARASIKLDPPTPQASVMPRHSTARAGGDAGARPHSAHTGERAGLGTAAKLSPRELEVLRLVAQGHTNREIAGILFISEKTAGVHITHILEKLGVRSRVEATAYAHRAGLVEPTAHGLP